MYKVGESGVYGSYGMVLIKGINERIIVGQKKTFVELETIKDKGKIIVPIENLEKNGFRKVISDDDVSEVYKILKNRDVKINISSWNRRCKKYEDKIKSGSIFEISEVLRDLFLIRHTKDLSFGERRMMNEAQAHIVKEISIAKSMQESIIEQEIQKIFMS